MPESAPSSSSALVTIPSSQDTARSARVNLVSSYFPSAEFVQSQLEIPSSAQVYPEELSHVPFPFQYDLDLEDLFSGTCDPCHSESLPPSNSTHDQSGRLSMGHSVQPYQQWLPVDPNTQIIPQPILSYASASSTRTFPGNSEIDIFAEIAGSSGSHLTAPNDGTGISTLPFPAYDVGGYYMCQ